MEIDISIDELVLDGVSIRDPERIRDAIATELGRLVAAGGLPAHFADGAAFNRIAAGPFETSGPMNGETIGIQVAQTIYGGPR